MNRGSFGCFISGEDDSYHKKATFGVEIDVIDYDEDGKRIPETFDGLDVEVDKWHMVVFTKSPSILNFYIDSRKVTFNGELTGQPLARSTRRSILSKSAAR